METPKHFERKDANGSITREEWFRRLGYNEALEKTNAKELWIENQKLKEENEWLSEVLCQIKNCKNRIDYHSDKKLIDFVVEISSQALDNANK